jgi:acyl-CoA dehydrogenase
MLRSLPWFETPEIAGLREATRALVRDLLRLEADYSRTLVVPEIVPRRLRELGYYGFTLPEEHGGLGLGAVAACAVLEELSWLPRPWIVDVVMNNGLGSRQIVRHGSEAQRSRWLPPLARGEALCAFALTEPEAGSDPTSMRTSAMRDAAGFRLNGRKHFITNGAKADVVTVMARTEWSRAGGITAFLVEKGAPGFTVAQIQRTMSGPPDAVAELVFEDCLVPEDAVVGELSGGLAGALRALAEGRVHMAASAVGMATRLLELSRDYARSRRQFGQAISEFQAVQHMLADMATGIHAARLMVYDAASRLDRGERARAEVSMTKVFATETAWKVADMAMQIHGGAGYMKDLPIERMMREIRLFRIGDGTSEIHRNQIARALLDDQ